MYPFWDPVIEPLVRAADARRIVEIGALRGETTVKMLADLPGDAELHVIDPVPQFDPSIHEKRFGGRYVFHRDLSLNVLPDAKPFDFALIDGDHNWYTVYNECRLLAEAALREGVHMPLMVLHDVGWPYGRRDLYYDPSNVPEEGRRPYAYRGMHPRSKTLAKRGGMNFTLANAIEEGGPRNGVRTGMEDFIAQHPNPIRQVILPIYFGLAIIAEEAYLEDHPEVAAFLDRLESHEGTRELLELSEAIRIDEVVFSHNIGRMNDERLARALDRHLSLLRASLVDEHYVENEARLDLALQSGKRIDPEVLRAPGSHRAPMVRDLDLRRAQGADGSGAGIFAYTDIGRDRLDEVHEALELVRTDSVPGDLVEVGCGRGGVGIYFRGFLDAHEIEDRTVWVCDEFRATPHGGPRPLDEGGKADLGADLNQVRKGFDRYGLLDDKVRFVEGHPADAVARADIGEIALLRIGRQAADRAEEILAAVRHRLADRAIVMVESAPDTLATPANVERLGWSGVAWRHRADAGAQELPAPRLGGRTIPLAPPEGSGELDLSVIVVFHNMAREAERTLHSLSRAYQRGVDGLRYEVIAIDNGSDPDQRLSAEFVSSFGPEFHLVDLGPDAHPSPVFALNEGMAMAGGDHLAFMIDGAHLLSPGVLHQAMRALRAHESAIVATQHWYIGPGQQPELVGDQYDQTIEDELFANIEWPSDGYRLFEISHFIGERDWLDGLLESNCIFAPRSLLAQVGGFDEGFDKPGAGFANLELYERLGSHPGTEVVTILGEGTFHQVHGGVTTNDGSIDERRAKTFGYGQDFVDLKGRPLKGPAKHLQFIGSFPSPASRRTRSRRLTAMAFDKPGERAGLPDRGRKMPDEVATGVIDSVWHTLSWQDTTWLGEPVAQTPADLVTYQELLTTIRPDHVIVIERDGHGTAAFLASICRLLDHGEVLALGPGPVPDVERLVAIEGSVTDEATVATVRDRLGDGPVMLVLGAGGRRHALITEFEAYAPFVTVDSYAIFEHTIVNGHPVWPGYGPGPLEALRHLLPIHGEFVQDTAIEKHGLTFNKGGYVRRMR